MWSGLALAQPSFKQDLVPLLTRYGCNSGGCHGKLVGQNGFRLSLRGFAPEWDHNWITAEMSGRRIDLAAPEQSLIFLKATGQIAHEGGRRFDKDSQAAKLLIGWIKSRAPGPDANEPDPARLEITPGGKTLKVGQTVQLTVNAHYADGRIRDVTWLTQFFSNDEVTASVTETGQVKALRPGETAIRAHFQGLVEIVMFTMPHESSIDAAKYAAKNNVIDDHVFAKLASLRIPVSDGCDDATFIRRAFLDCIGTLPTPDETIAFLKDTRADKRARLVDDLLARPEWTDYWTMQLCDILQNRKERDHDVRGAKGVRSFHAWVRNQLAHNRPWDRIVHDVLTSIGDTASAPAIGYYITTIGEKSNVAESEVAESVAQSFLGVRIGCAKCHNHPLEKFTQDDYYRFVAFFSRVSLKRTDPEKGVTTLAVASREEQEARKQLADAEKALADAQKANKDVANAQKRVIDQQKRIADIMAKPPGVTQPRTRKMMSAMPLDRTTPTFQPGQDPRETLAAWITDPANPSFSGAMVNRLWRHFMGVGLVEQVDDLRSSNPPTNPALWIVLNREFVAAKFDLKSTMRLIMTSRAYQLSSSTVPGNEQDRRFYSHYYARRLPAEVLMDAISSATGVADSFSGYPVGVRAISIPDPGVTSYFLTLFGRSERVTACACERAGDVTLPQLLHLANADELQKKLRAADGRLVTILKAQSDDDAIDTVFLATLNKLPSPAQKSAVTDALKSGDAREDVYRDLFWALLNSKEFTFNH